MGQGRYRQDLYHAQPARANPHHQDGAGGGAFQQSWRDGGPSRPLDVDACKVEFDLDFEFTSKLIELAFGQIFRELVSSMVLAFSNRAKVVYGV